MNLIFKSFDLVLGHLADAFIQSDLQLVHLSEEREYSYCTVGWDWYDKIYFLF